MKGIWRCRLQRTFFGLSLEYIKNVYEQFFFLKYYGAWSFVEAYSLPVGLRRWFVERLSKQLEKEKQSVEKASKSGRSNMPSRSR
jgi:hypothetical protein